MRFIRDIIENHQQLAAAQEPPAEEPYVADDDLESQDVGPGVLELTEDYAELAETGDAPETSGRKANMVDDGADDPLFPEDDAESETLDFRELRVERTANVAPIRAANPSEAADEPRRDKFRRFGAMKTASAQPAPEVENVIDRREFRAVDTDFRPERVVQSDASRNKTHSDQNEARRQVATHYDETPGMEPLNPQRERAQNQGYGNDASFGDMALKDAGRSGSSSPQNSVDELRKHQEQHAQVPPSGDARGRGNSSRAKTRLLGFATGAAGADPLARLSQADDQEDTRFPVGWVVVVDGPGRGHSFQLSAGVSQIGRADDQNIRLDFGDGAISRHNHAAIAYDVEQNAFFIGHGGKANIVRRNNRPVLSTEELVAGDKIRVGETTLRFVPLCGSDFSWDEPKQTGPSRAILG